LASAADFTGEHQFAATLDESGKARVSRDRDAVSPATVRVIGSIERKFDLIFSIGANIRADGRPLPLKE